MRMPISLMMTRAVQFLILSGVMSCAASLVSDGNKEAVQRRAAGKSINFVPSKAYATECTSCHVGYLPGFLPERSWNKLMAGLDNHFGENASLDEPVLGEIKKYLVTNSADKPASSIRSKKIAKMIPLDESPIRIIDTPFWTRRHNGIKKYVWKREKVQSKSSCNSCHRDADKGIFDEHDMHIPK